LCHGFGGAHQGRREALTAGAAMHQHLRHVGAMRLVLGLVEHQMHGGAEAMRIFGDQQRALARGQVVRHITPERSGAVAQQRVHEAHRRTAFDTVDQDARSARHRARAGAGGNTAKWRRKLRTSTECPPTPMHAPPDARRSFLAEIARRRDIVSLTSRSSTACQRMLTKGADVVQF
jgi:hypothetical protein